MDRLDRIIEEAGVSDFDIRMEQRRTALIQEIHESLERKGWTQSDLAEEMDKEDSQVTRLLSPTSNPTLATIVEIETALGEDLFTVNRNLKFKVQEGDIPGWKRAISQSSHEAGTENARVKEKTSVPDGFDVRQKVRVSRQAGSGT